MAMTCKDLIEKAGGSMAVAHSCGKSQHAVVKWETRGIPVKYWETIRRLTGEPIPGIYRAVLRTKKLGKRGGVHGNRD